MLLVRALVSRGPGRTTHWKQQEVGRSCWLQTSFRIEEADLVRCYAVRLGNSGRLVGTYRLQFHIYEIDS
jgi:hypothetical protein